MSDAGSQGGSRRATRRPWLPLAAAALSLLLLAALLEIFCQAYARAVVFPRLESRRESPRHYYRASANPVLGYELAPNSELSNEDRRLHINRYGLREDGDDLAAGKRRIAILGDSVVFGVNHSQEDTIPALVQREIDASGERVKVLNFSVGGYAIEQLAAQLRDKNRIYDVDDVVYLLNFNDFASHDSIYEGADNGMYRTYVRPRLMSPFFVRKAIYRMKKGGKNGSEGWYHWFYEGNEERGQAILREMARYAKTEGFWFGVVLLPSGLSYSDGRYRLQDLHDRLGAALAEAGIPHLDPVDVFARDPGAYYDPTDHFHGDGNAKMAQLIAEFIASEAPGSN
jgi:lysophospholipase L1-like esterase